MRANTDSIDFDNLDVKTNKKLFGTLSVQDFAKYSKNAALEDGLGIQGYKCEGNSRFNF